MSIAKSELDEFIRGRQFAELFIRCGWDREGLSPAPLELPRPQADGRPVDYFSVQVVAEKRGFAVCVCDAGAAYPSTRSARRHLVNQLSRHHYEHLLIICGQGKQCWSAAIRPQNRPLRFVEVEWNERQDIQPLMEKLDGIIFDISEEEGLGITDVVDRVRNAFMEGADKTTRKFYERFQKELRAFAGFIDGIDKHKQWYSALMLNRLMFIYFIQKRRFLDGDSNYLQNRLRQTQAQHGPDQFHAAFYRDFLRQLFAEGLDTPVAERGADVEQRFGKIPYLNGGLFELHAVEEQNPGIAIADAAFENLFAFFDQYNWHLDTRPSASGRDINPDVLGYIFEKYINDRAAMGAYYTQEDITGYIARNTIIPFLLRRAKEQCANAFHAGGIWRLLRDNPDHYIYEAARKGCDIPDSELPETIRRGIDAAAPGLLQRRRHWNEAADEAFALPTETWREVIARRARYFALKEKMQGGRIHRIDDLITHNLDIERFAADALRDYEGSDFIAAFFAAIAGRKAQRADHKDRRGVTVLDPACGSGAFLFAALNVLEPLYEKCIERMEDFVAEDDRLRDAGARKGTKKHEQFRKVLEEIGKHPNQQYWIYKTIILNNLYGVDLMKEAAEIAKLRLFLKLAAEARYEPTAANLGLEPLPDIDFNIRAGNSLVGFASMAEFESIAGGELVERRLMSKIREDARLAQMADKRFRESQNQSGEDYRRAKQELAGRLDALNQNMNRYLAKQYGVDDDKPEEYEPWRQTHQPFHWLAEFYGIVEEDGGFDVVIGNPPYVEYDKELQRQYRLNGYRTERAGNLYAFFVERNDSIVSDSGWSGMIVPHSAFCTDRMSSLNPFFENKKRWVSTYGTRPAKLFKDAEQNLAIYILSQQKGDAYSGAYTLWSADYRDCLFQNTCYGPIPDNKLLNTTPKIGDHLSAGVLAKICKHADLPVNERSDHQIYYNNTGRYWTRATDFVPHFWNERDGEKQSTQVKTLAFSNRAHALAVCALLNSSLFYWWFLLCSDCRHLNMREIENFPFNPHRVDKAILAELASVVGDLMADYRRHATRKETQYKTTGKVVYDEFHPSHSKAIMDRIDTALAKHYHFTEVELDYIINYDIKYRMGGGKGG